ncbi:UNVERIFIED_CONTAM: hypothetical protein PYX00_001564 [Menopon gallinae]|uniref:Mitochondrial carrier-like protein 2 n=1 Tax=Menopon gallinae TaxID=328185 RepID=A0AAW2IEK9_9NEOP
MYGSTPKEDKELKWARIGYRLVLTTLTHPIEYAKFLIQIGYEPLPPRPTKTLFGRPALALPNVFGYISYIKSVDGTAGYFRGLSAKLCANIVNGVTFESVKESIRFESDIKSLIDEEDVDPEVERRHKFAKDFMKELAGRTAAVITSHPFQVIAGRMMAEFIGGEHKYSSFIDAVKEIYRLSGISGFYAGIIPRLIGDLLAVCIITSCTYLIHVHCTDDKEIRNYCNVLVGFFASSFTYPFHVVSNCMTVTASGLKAGSPPYMPEYKSWLNCWRHLKSTNQIKRGSTLFWRYYTGPFNVVAGVPVMLPQS